MPAMFRLSSTVLMLLFSSAAYSACLHFGRNNDNSLCKSGPHVTARDKSHALGISNGLAHYLSRTDDFFVVKGNIPGHESAIYVRLPSRPYAQGKGYCGAGHEDYILLVDRVGNELNLSDAVLIQSCLKNISLASDRGDDPRQAVRPARPPMIADFDLINSDGVIQSKGVKIQKGKLLLIQGSN